MKSVFIVFFFFFFFCNAQKFSFDYVLKYEKENIRTKKKSESVNYFNTHDYNYRLRLLRVDDKLVAELYDIKKNNTHNFDVIEQTKDNEIFFSFNYISTTKSYHLSLIDKSYFEFTNGDFGEVDLTIFKNRNKKKVECSYHLEMSNSEKNLFPAFRATQIHPYNNTQNLVYPENIVVERATFMHRENTCEVRLVMK